MIRLQVLAADSARAMYQEEINTAAERIEILTEELSRARQQMVSESATESRQAAFDEIVALGLDRFWDQSSLKVNQTLPRLLGDYRLVVDKGRITGIGKDGWNNHRKRSNNES